ncbi:MAG TPA: (2Fe-2S) ferredoxin domain-containing protein [Anaeromyxobacteraceae bacterium]|nr:(2Fe-2S) ferredoxin domain-containing protein [Anaeromyxobacteraceae bacterium]
MSRFRHHVFVCENVRPADDPRGSCGAKGSPAIREALKAELKRRGLAGAIRANSSGCLDACADGPSVVVYPEGVWYAHVRVEDVPDIVDSLVAGGRVERLLNRRFHPGAAVDTRGSHS